MMMGTALIVLIIIALGIWIWTKNLQSKEIATRAAKSTCEKEDLQFLDGTTIFHNMRFKRDKQGRIGVERHYQFDYFDGENRLTGSISLFKQQVIYLSIQPTNLFSKKPNDSDKNKNNVIQFPHKK